MSLLSRRTLCKQQKKTWGIRNGSFEVVGTTGSYLETTWPDWTVGIITTVSGAANIRSYSTRASDGERSVVFSHETAPIAQTLILEQSSVRVDLDKTRYLCFDLLLASAAGSTPTLILDFSFRGGAYDEELAIGTLMINSSISTAWTTYCLALSYPEGGAVSVVVDGRMRFEYTKSASLYAVSLALDNVRFTDTPPSGSIPAN